MFFLPSCVLVRLCASLCVSVRCVLCVVRSPLAPFPSLPLPISRTSRAKKPCRNRHGARLTGAALSALCAFLAIRALPPRLPLSCVWGASIGLQSRLCRGLESYSITDTIQFIARFSLAVRRCLPCASVYRTRGAGVSISTTIFQAHFAGRFRLRDYQEGNRIALDAGALFKLAFFLMNDFLEQPDM